MDKKQVFRKFFGIFSFFMAIIFVIFLVLNIRNISDYFRSQSFKPSNEISKITTDLELTDYAKTVFFAVNPQIESADEFNKNCSKQTEKTSVLGCYKSDEIHVFDVKSDELNGVKEVTAAHELLHAIWARLSESERKNLGEILRENYEKIKTPKFEELMKKYQESEPNEIENELHSIIGTEYLGISDELENHYAKYFKNRQKIVEFRNNYSQKLEDLENRAETLNNDLNTLKKEIEDESRKYDEDSKNLQAEIEKFNEKAKSVGGFLSDGDFQSKRKRLLSKVDEINARHDAINSKVATYNSKREELLKISAKSNELHQSLDSNFVRPLSL